METNSDAKTVLYYQL